MWSDPILFIDHAGDQLLQSTSKLSISKVERNLNCTDLEKASSVADSEIEKVNVTYTRGEGTQEGGWIGAERERESVGF